MKKNIIIILTVFTTIVVSLFIIYSKNDKMVPVLGYHSVLPKNINTSNDNLIVDQEKFEEQLKILDKLGFKTMTLDDFYCWKNGQCKKKHNSVLITFDDGYKNNYEYAFKLLKKYNMNAVVFNVGIYTESYSDIHMNVKEIEKIKTEYPNIEFASHSYNLHYHSDKKYEEVNDDIQKMKTINESQYYAYPFGDYTEEYINALKDNEYKMAFTFGPSKEHRKAKIDDDNYKIPRLNIAKDISNVKFILRLLLPI